MHNPCGDCRRYPVCECISKDSRKLKHCSMRIPISHVPKKIKPFPKKKIQKEIKDGASYE